MKSKRKILFSCTGSKDKDWFAVATTSGGGSLNFWHDNSEHVYFYTFRVTDRYNQGVKWCKSICRELRDELAAQVPELEVVRFAIDGKYYILPPDGTGKNMPIMPCRPHNWNATYLKQQQAEALNAERTEIELRKGKEPAPYVLFGTHKGRKKEYAWKLTPDKAKRQNIAPGDRVRVWTRYGWRVITVTRIEKAENVSIQPTYRVKNKTIEDQTGTTPIQG